MRLPVRIVFEQRGEAPKRLSALVPLVSVLAALFFGAIFLLATGYSPWEAPVSLMHSRVFIFGACAYSLLSSPI